MACHLFGANPLFRPMLAYCQLSSWEQISVKCQSQFYRFHIHSKKSFAKVANILSGGRWVEAHDTTMTMVNIRPSDILWWDRSGWQFAQVMACCLMAPSRYLKKCWLAISEARWHLAQGNITHTAQDITLEQEFENDILESTVTSSSSQWVNSW